MGVDVFGTMRLGCKMGSCSCTSYISKIDAMTHDERGATVVHHPRNSPEYLICTCNHSVSDHNTENELAEIPAAASGEHPLQKCGLCQGRAGACRCVRTALGYIPMTPSLTSWHLHLPVSLHILGSPPSSVSSHPGITRSPRPRMCSLQQPLTLGLSPCSQDAGDGRPPAMVKRILPQVFYQGECARLQKDRRRCALVKRGGDSCCCRGEQYCSCWLGLARHRTKFVKERLKIGRLGSGGGEGSSTTRRCECRVARRSHRVRLLPGYRSWDRWTGR